MNERAMEELTDRIAVVTGGASGLGRAFGERFVDAGMKVVLADIEGTALDATVTDLKAAGGEVAGVVCDVSNHQSVVDLAAEVDSFFGPPQVVCLNAGVRMGAPRILNTSDQDKDADESKGAGDLPEASGGRGPGGLLAETTMADWTWVLGVNLWGVIHGVDVFLPGMRKRNEGHVVFTASMAGHHVYPAMGSYAASKYAVVAIAETLQVELLEAGSAVGVTCLCPGLVSTNIFTSERNRPGDLATSDVEPLSAEEEAHQEMVLKWLLANGHEPSSVAELVHQAIVANTFWVLPDDSHFQALADRLDSIKEQRSP